MERGLARALAAATALAASLTPAIARAEGPRDFEGTWMRAGERGMEDFLLGVDLPYTDEARNMIADYIDWTRQGRGKASAHLTCRPTGVQGITAPKLAVLIMQTPQTTYMMSQEDREVRRIHTQRGHLPTIVPSYSGDSVATWDGDTLVVDTIGYNGHGQLDELGNPHSDQLHVVERWSKSVDGKTLTARFTFTDPRFYTAPFTKTRTYRRVDDARIGDYDCADNPREDDFANLTFVDDWFKPVCVRPEANGGDGKVVCTRPKAPTIGSTK